MLLLGQCLSAEQNAYLKEEKMKKAVHLFLEVSLEGQIRNTATIINIG